MNGAMNYFYCSLVGIITAILVAWITNYYTSYSKRPTLEIANASQSGPAPSLATGLAVGMESSGLFIVVIGVAILFAFGLGNGFTSLGSRLDIANPAFQRGIYGTAIATMGMLSVTPMILAMDGFGPITDNAGGILEMSGAAAKVRAISDKLDSVGNTTKALTKGYGVAFRSIICIPAFQRFPRSGRIKRS